MPRHRLPISSSACGGTNPDPCRDAEVRPSVQNVSSLHFSPAHGSLLAATTLGGLLKLWDVRGCHGGELVQAFQRATSGHLHPLHCSAWRPDGGALFAGDARGGMLQWDLATGAVAGVADLGSQVLDAFSVAELGALMVVAADRRVLLVDPRIDGRRSASCGELCERPTASAVAFPTAAIATRSRYLVLLDLRMPCEARKTRRWGPHWGETTCVAASPCGRSVFCGSSCGNVVRLSTDGMAVLGASYFKTHRGRVVSWVGPHPRAQVLVTAGAGRYKFWCSNGETLCCVRRSRDCGGRICRGGFNAEGTVFAYLARVVDPSKVGPFVERGDRLALHAVAPEELARPTVEDAHGEWSHRYGMEVVTLARGIRNMDLFSPEACGEGFDCSSAVMRGVEGMDLSDHLE